MFDRCFTLNHLTKDRPDNSALYCCMSLTLCHLVNMKSSEMLLSTGRKKPLTALHCKHGNHPDPHSHWPTEVSPDPSSVHIRKVFWTNIYSSYITDWMKTLIGCPITRTRGQGSGCRATLLNQVEDMDRKQCHSLALPANRKEGCNIIFMLWVCRAWPTQPKTLNPPHHKEQLTPCNVS